MIYLGIDPGKSGGIAILDGEQVLTLSFAKATDHDVAAFLLENVTRTMSGHMLGQAVIERVSSSPQMGVVSAFTFGDSCGFLRGLLTANRLPYTRVTPQKWQKSMGCMSKGDKNVTKAAAQRLYPQEKITHANADALLLATYCRRHASDLF